MIKCPENKVTNASVWHLDGAVSEADWGMKIMNEVKISMLGVSGSGKTAFLSGICDTFISGNIEVKDEKNNDRSHLFKILPYQADNMNETSIGDVRRYSIRNNRSFTAVNTENTKKYMLNLFDDTFSTADPLCTVSFIDYKGGFVENLVNEKSGDEVKDVRDELLSSNVILIFADAVRLSRAENTGEFNTALGSDDINTFFNTNSFVNKKLTVLFVLTKDDSPEVSGDDELLTERLLHSFETTVRIIERNGWTYGVIRTSAVGRNSVDPVTNRITPDAEIIPYGIDSVLFYSIYRTVSEEVTALHIRISDMENANVITKMSREYRNRMKILKSQLEETDAVMRFIRIPYNCLRVSDRLVMEKRAENSGISAVTG
ncbi:MAG: hypothetical protein MJ095_02385 [Oscillospiraceae bacterium]|nr:hypothetical protein [Oscillospiraceae bacterium]